MDALIQAAVSGGGEEGDRGCGAVAITEKSRSPSSDIASVRGIGLSCH